MEQEIIANILQNLRSLRPIISPNKLFAEDLNELDELIADAEEPLLVMVMGEFSTGKSTFINALVGREIAAMNATPTTAVITKLCYGSRDEIIVHFKDGSKEQKTSQEFVALTAEADAESNKLHEKIDYVERRIPLDVLKSVTIIDSPGLNAIKTEHSTATRRFMDKADTVLWMLSAENAGSQTEITAMEELSPRLKPFALVNKMDQVDEDEESPEELLANIRGLLGDHVQAVIGISAEMALKGKMKNDAALLEESCIAKFYEVIEKEVLPHRDVYKLNTLLAELSLLVYSFGETLEEQEKQLSKLKQQDYAAYISKKTELAPIKDGVEDLAGIVYEFCQNDRKNLVANVFLGVLYRFGIAVEKNVEKFSELLEKAAIRHEKQAQTILTMYYADADEADKALCWAQQGAGDGNDYCQAFLGCMYLAGNMVEADNEKALANFKLAAAQDNFLGHYGEGHMYLYGIGVERDADYAWSCLQKAARQGMADAFYELGNCCLNSWGTKYDAVQMAAYYQKAVDAGSEKALAKLGQCYAEGVGVGEDIAKGLDYLQQAADKDSTEALTYLGNLYKYDKRVKQDEKKAFDYYKRSAELGEAEAQYEISCCYRDGIGTEKDKRAGRKWLQKAVEQEYPWALYQQGLYLEDGDGIPKDEEKAFKLFEKAAQAGLFWAKLKLADCWNYGWLHQTQDLPRAIEIYQELIDRGERLAKYRMAELYQTGKGVPKDISKYLELLTAAAEDGLSQAQSDLGQAYYFGNDVEKDDNKAFYWLETSAKQGNEAISMYGLSMCYMEGTGTDKDINKCVYWLRKAAEAGLPLAQLDLGKRYRNGDGVTKDERSAFNWIKKAAKQGNAEAENLLGVFYSDGIGVKENAKEAIHWYKKAAEHGDTWGYYNLGQNYQYGWGTSVDEEKAYQCFNKAAEKGNICAFVKTGYFYEHSKGSVTQNKQTAFTWYKKAADQNLDEGQYHLGRCYELGIGVPADEYTAEKWYKKAAEQDYQKAKDALDKLLKTREKRAQARKKIDALQKKAVEGDCSAHYELGQCYGNGVDVIRDENKALEHYLEAASMGVAKAQLEVGLIYSKRGEGQKACQWFANAANQGLTEAQFQYGKCLVNGFGIARNIYEGRQWLQAAAEKGDASAKQRLEQLDVEQGNVSAKQMNATKNPPKETNQEDSSGGCCGCLIIIFILFLLMKILK